MLIIILDTFCGCLPTSKTAFQYLNNDYDHTQVY